jgi:dienelactone hydrolase
METRAETRVPAGSVDLAATVHEPGSPHGVVVFAHGSGSSRFSPRNRQVADRLQREGLGTVLADLLTPEEEQVDLRTGRLRFDIGLLADRLVAIIDWLGREPGTVGLFGASTGGGAALVAAAARSEPVGAVVSRGGRPDLAGDALPLVRAPTLLIVGSRDDVVLELNRQAYEQLTCEKRLVVVPGATHLFEEPGALDQVADLAAAWFTTHLGS